MFRNSNTNYNKGDAAKAAYLDGAFKGFAPGANRGLILESLNP
jgi:hypothetical protein